MNIPLHQIAPYLPFNLKIQYRGIVNGKVLSVEHKQFQMDGHPFDFTEAQYGLKTGTLKEIKIYKNYWKCYIVNSGRALKSFINGFDFKPLLIPLTPIQSFVVLTTEECLLVSKGLAHNIPQWKFEILVENHYDVFGLIDAGVALNKNEIIM